MPTSDEIRHYLTGAWRLMMGKPDGLRLLDVSGDGFWRSFWAIPVALPAMIIGWLTITDSIGDGAWGSQMSVLLRLGVVDLMAWVLPLAALGLIAKTIGIADRFAPFVVASNWSSPLLVWLMLPVWIVYLVLPGQPEVGQAVSLAAFVLAMVLTWRLTNAVLGKGPGLATGVFVFVLIASVLLQVSLQSLMGLGPATPA